MGYTLFFCLIPIFYNLSFLTCFTFVWLVFFHMQEIHVYFSVSTILPFSPSIPHDVFSGGEINVYFSVANSVT